MECLVSYVLFCMSVILGEGVRGHFYKCVSKCNKRILVLQKACPRTFCSTTVYIKAQMNSFASMCNGICLHCRYIFSRSYVHENEQCGVIVLQKASLKSFVSKNIPDYARYLYIVLNLNTIKQH